MPAGPAFLFWGRGPGRAGRGRVGRRGGCFSDLTGKPIKVKKKVGDKKAGLKKRTDRRHKDATVDSLPSLPRNIETTHSEIQADQRVVLTLDAGGTSFRFSAMRAGKPVSASVITATYANDL